MERYKNILLTIHEADSVSINITVIVLLHIQSTGVWSLKIIKGFEPLFKVFTVQVQWKSTKVLFFLIRNEFTINLNLNFVECNNVLLTGACTINLMTAETLLEMQCS